MSTVLALKTHPPTIRAPFQKLDYGFFNQSGNGNNRDYWFLKFCWKILVRTSREFVFLSTHLGEDLIHIQNRQENHELDVSSICHCRSCSERGGFWYILFLPLLYFVEIIQCENDCGNGGVCNNSTGLCECSFGCYGDFCETCPLCMRFCRSSSLAMIPIL